MDAPAVEIIKKQEATFLEKFGRPMGSDDRIFFDVPDEEECERVMTDAMVKVGIRPELIYAFKVIFPELVR